MFEVHSTPLLQILSTWRGRQAMQTAFEQKGFLIHLRWQERMIDLCGRDKAAELKRYWDESAAEFVRCAGKVHSDHRRFGVDPPPYRSSYLDQLASKVDFAEPPYRHPPLLKCVYEYRRRSQTDRPFHESERSYFEGLKEREISGFSVSSDGLEDKKRDLVPFVKMIGAPRGYEERRRRFVKKSQAGLIFEIKLDLGGIPHRASGLPLKLYIYHKSNREFVFEATLLDAIVPGFFRYGYCPTPDSTVLGLLAHIEFFDLLFYSFGV
jgi:hypothetical protein